MAIADRKRELISIRTEAALEAAKKSGVKLSTPEHFSQEGRLKVAAQAHLEIVLGGWMIGSRRFDNCWLVVTNSRLD